MPSSQGQFPKRERTKVNLKKLAEFSAPKNTTQNTTIVTHSTTNSPRFYLYKTPENRKTPRKNDPFPGQNIFLQNTNPR
jgi:hypothetical protein